jgi:hypothetical protein
MISLLTWTLGAVHSNRPNYALNITKMEKMTQIPFIIHQKNIRVMWQFSWWHCISKSTWHVLSQLRNSQIFFLGFLIEYKTFFLFLFHLPTSLFIENNTKMERLHVIFPWFSPYWSCSWIINSFTTLYIGSKVWLFPIQKSHVQIY